MGSLMHASHAYNPYPGIALKAQFMMQSTCKSVHTEQMFVSSLLHFVS